MGKDLVRAATSDNVQPLALLSCERFGATLAICPRTRTTIEVLLKSQTEHVVLKFLKARVGFASGGSISQLARSMAGVNFLALTAALVSISNTFEAGLALEKMIISSAADKTLVPTAYQLKDLLDVLEPRLNRVGFLTDVLGWKNWWINNEDISERSRVEMIRIGDPFPDADGLQKVVAALREVARIGEAKTASFTAGYAAPWLTAFIKWCIGEPPTILGPNGQVLLSQPSNPIDIIYSGEETFYRQIQIKLVTTFGSFTEIIVAKLERPPHTAAGMVDIQTHAKYVLRSANIQSGLGSRALMQALPYALKQIRDFPICGGRPEENVDEHTLDGLRSNAFPQESTIANVMARYLSLDEQPNLKVLPEGTLVTDLPLVSLWIKQQKTDLRTHGGLEFISRGLSCVVADILALSLFDGCLDSLLVYYDPYVMLRLDLELADNITSVLLGKMPPPCSVDPILKWALFLVHHEVSASLVKHNWVGSSFHGQVAFPKLFEDQLLRKHGYLELYCIPGTLTVDGLETNPFSLVEGATSSLGIGQTDEAETWVAPVTRSLNLYRNEKILWKIQTLKDCISAGVGWSRDLSIANPFDLLQGLALAIFVESCPHDINTPISHPPTDCQYIPLLNPLAEIIGDEETSPETVQWSNSSIKVFPVLGDNGLRMIALGSLSTDVTGNHDRIQTVVSNGACLNCLINQCRLTGCNFILL
ncbi:MAG: hypothetical protein Q9187_001180 [Circinaria calcarea]